MTRIAVVFLLSAGTVFAAMDGTVVNKTTGKPQAGVTVNLLKPGAQGMQQIGTTVILTNNCLEIRSDPEISYRAGISLTWEPMGQLWA